MKRDNNFYRKLGMKPEKKSFKRYLNAGLLDDIDEDFVEETRNYWERHYNKRIDPLLNIALANLTGKKDKRVAPPVPVLWNEIIPYFNDMNIRVGYSDKNIYDKLIAPTRGAEDVIKKIRGYYYSENNEPITLNEALNVLAYFKEDLIIKPSNADNGIGITKIKYIDGRHVVLEKPINEGFLEGFGYNFVIQKVIKQHPVLAEPHPYSVNTLRIVTFRWKQEIHYLLSYLRMGVKNQVMDNSVAGGIVVGINDYGEFYNYAIDKELSIYDKHPSTGFEFKKLVKVPNFQEAITYVKKLHSRVLHHDLVSWDIAIGEDEKPIFIEMNFRGPTSIYQLASQKPMFGDLTEEVLEHVSENLKSHNRNSESDYFKLNRKHKKLKREYQKLSWSSKKTKIIFEEKEREIKILQTEKNKLEKEKAELESKIRYMENSKSWKVTAPLRKLIK